MKAILELGGRSPGGTRRRWRTAGEAHPTIPGQLAGRRPGEPGGRLVAGRFRLRSLLGRGGMGRVWLADDELLDRPVAVKQLLLHGLESAEMRAQAWAHALREARAAARVHHIGAVRIYDVVQEEGWPWIVMEPLPGRTLQQALDAARPLSVRQVTRVGLRLVDVLQATHQAGIVHRDVKPGNVHLCGGGRVVLTDFGIASAIEDAAPAAGRFLGTPAYVSPERLAGGDSGPASDLFSLGATLFTAVEGGLPFERGSLLATLTAVLLDRPAPFLRAGPLRPVIEGLLAKDPGRRLNADQARDALQAIQREHHTAPGRTSRTYAAPPSGSPCRPADVSNIVWRQDQETGMRHAHTLLPSAQPDAPGLAHALLRLGSTRMEPGSFRFWLERDLDEQCGAVAGRAGDVERAAERLDAVPKPDQSRPPGGDGSPDPVVADRQLQDRVGCVEFDVHGGSACVLGHVG
jgi:serine/threonine protein kinase